MTQIVYKLNKYTAIYSCVATIALIMALPIALPIMQDNLKTATSNKLRAIAEDLKPTTFKVSKDELASMPPRMNLAEIAAKYPAANSDVIAEILENN